MTQPIWILSTSSMVSNFNFNQVTGGDGCICYMEYNKARNIVEFVGMKQIRERSYEMYNQSLCDELLSPILPAKPSFHPRQFERCAVVGNSGDLFITNKIW